MFVSVVLRSTPHDPLHNHSSPILTNTPIYTHTNINTAPQFIFYITTTNVVFLREHSRGLYTVLSHWLVSSIPGEWKGCGIGVVEE
jgi:hypothetical protein